MAKIKNIIMIIFLLVGVGILLYPDFMNWQESQKHVRVIQDYNENIALMATAELNYELMRARAFNEGITDISMNDPWGAGANDITGTEEYYTLLRFGDRTGVMGRLQIPRIRVDLPIRHGTGSDALDRGVGHMPHTSLPIGGYGNHSILTAHTGMVSSRLFNDLIELYYGDIFFVTIGDDRLAYRIDQIDEVEPHEIDVLQTYADRDLITLVTCTPYGINTHRLLVRGYRIPYHEVVIEEIEPIEIEPNSRILAVIGIVVFVPLLLIFKWWFQKVPSAEYLAEKHEKEYNKVFGG